MPGSVTNAIRSNGHERAVAGVAAAALGGEPWETTAGRVAAVLASRPGMCAAVMEYLPDTPVLRLIEGAGLPAGLADALIPVPEGSALALASAPGSRSIRVEAGTGWTDGLEMLAPPRLCTGILQGFALPDRVGLLAAFADADDSIAAVEASLVPSMAEILTAAAERVRSDAESRETEQRLRLAQTAGRMGTWGWDIRSGEVEWSESLEMLHGLTPGTFGRTFEAFTGDVHPADIESLLASIERALETGTHEVEYRCIIPGGRTVWVEARGQVLYDAHGRPSRIVGVCADITQRKRVEDALQLLSDVAIELAISLEYDETLQRLAHVVVPRFADWCAVDLLTPAGDAIERVAIAHHDPSRAEAIEHIRRQPIDMHEWRTGVGSAVATGKSLVVAEVTDEMIADPRVPEATRIALRELVMRSVMIVPLRVRGTTIGAMTFVRGDSGHLYDEQDLAVAEHVCRRAGLSVDNARLYREAQIIEANLRRANEAKDEFLGLMSHELRTPITVIYGGAHLLRSRALTVTPEERDQILADIEGEADRLYRMVENLLALSRAELQDIELEPVLVQRVLKRYVDTFAERGITRLTLEADDQLPPVAGHTGYLEHIVRNLVGNAIKYSPPESPISIRVSQPSSDRVAVSVADRGSGVPADEVDKIFQRFYRSDGTANMASGAGMGLAVCTRLLDAMRGEIQARRRDGGGLEVTFSLPVNEEAPE